MQRVLQIIIGLIAALTPLTMHAETYTTLNLRQGQTNAQWKVRQDIAVSRRPDGLLLTAATQTGILVTDVTLSDIPNAATGYDGFPQVAVLVTDASAAQSILFGWVTDDTVEDNLSMLPVTVGAGTDIATYVVLHREPEWRPPVRQIAILLPPGTSILLKEVTFVRWSITERFFTALRSLLSFDEYRMYAINFVWGPRLAWTPVQRALIWDTLPPGGTSAMYVLNILLVIGIGIIFWRTFTARGDTEVKRRNFFVRTTALLLTAWILLDIRMGSELLSWFARDARTYVFAPAGAKLLRDFDAFHEFAMFASPLVSDRESYVLFTPREYPDVAQMRYYTYPSIPGQNTKDDTWVVFGRDDIGVLDDRIVVSGQVATGIGEVLGRFDDTSFVFRVSP